ncbi:MAG: AGE family epimerase/isomerase [Actinomycetales bacterium]|jgi:sulfoquinovose isomerase|nr:AGE family epimerase/isomerase [Candidatus Phosphoribacter baldrii]MBK6956290.1 AGE family epimerase/isomerase [Candidatus Phosphoribacter baldrii]
MNVSLPAAHAQRLDQHATSLAALVANAAHPDGGFGWLGPDNRVVLNRPVETWITARMTHVAALEVMRKGEAAAHLRPLLDVGYAALTGRLRDHEFRGWLPAVGGTEPQSTDKVAYAHAFVILAAASLTAAGHPGGPDLLREALDVFDTYFWDEETGMAREQYDRAWSRCEDYRGVNANMHTVEAMLAAGEVLGEPRYTDRALRILRRVVDDFARTNDWRLPEHFDAQWNVLPDYNRDRPADQFRPYGVTIGHVLEWSRLALNARHTLGAAAADENWSFLLDDAAGLFEAAIGRGWDVDGAEGLVYTTDFADVPIVRERLHWVVCEGIAAAWALHEATGAPGPREWFDRLWAYADRYLLDAEHGGWRHELSPTNEPSDTIWWGKPDLYHAYQCALVPLLPGMVSFAGACRPRG